MKKYKWTGDNRYEKIKEQMDLLGITDVTTNRQHKNGTIVWQLPIQSRYDSSRFLEYASFSTGYVRNQGVECHSNYQVNKQVSAKPRYFELPNGDYRKYEGVERVLIPIEIDRLEYLISYCLKNYYIKHANFVANGDYVAKWTHEYEMNGLQNKLANSVPKWKYDEAMNLGKEQDCGHYDRIRDLENKLDTIKRISDYE